MGTTTTSLTISPAVIAALDLTLPAGCTATNATSADLQAVFEVISAADLADFGEPEMTEEDLSSEWAGADPQRDVFLVRAADGLVVGYVRVDASKRVRILADGYVHPDWHGRGIGRALVRLSEWRARELVDLAPPDARVILGHGVNAASPTAMELMATEGLTPVRYFWRMEAPLDHSARPETVEWPADISVVSCAERGEAGPTGPSSWTRPNGTLTGERAAAVAARQRQAFSAIDEAFQDHWGHVTLTFDEWFARKGPNCPDPSLWYLALDGDEVVGGIIGAWYNGQGWVEDLGVRRAWRKRGLGEALLRHIMAEYARRGVTRVSLGVDTENVTGATRLYERVGMRPVRQFGIFEKELRPGQPAATD